MRPAPQTTKMRMGVCGSTYEDMSRGDYTIEGRVVNQVQEDDPNLPIWVTLEKTKGDYHKLDGKTITQAKQSFVDAVLAAAASQQGINTTTNEKRKICIIYAGNKYYIGGLHPHYRRGENLYIMSERTAAPYGVEVNSAKFSPIGTHCHEFGHVLGLGDKYSREGNVHGRSYGWWGLMAGGNHKGGGAPSRPLCRPITEQNWAGLSQPRSRSRAL